ncbi:MAG: hypothetical protein UX13_C0031G0006 [Candidatus Woesebacteria bacterium GW2011_GWB1_45_5]|uniref:Uncharacterized protein n=1 Tax=Candidatus Woesebacteria bacterium GW2011_GWB1_45_5 TaxID=1618581 RepID=A0A0G1MNT6_9BACT|nr:MAG: hypothetical protein UX13_C0031G0006 [Candidatus Woesebacteria bacterium GW2011_GWB1_45_5]
MGVEGILFLQKLLVSSGFFDPAFFHDNNPIRLGNGREPVGDNDGGFAGPCLPERILNEFFGLGV